MDYTVSFYQEGDKYLFGGSPWNPKYHDIWREQSPISYAQDVTAPTLVMGDVGDSNVPLLNSYEDIVRTTDVYRRWVAWMTKYLK